MHGLPGDVLGLCARPAALGAALFSAALTACAHGHFDGQIFRKRDHRTDVTYRVGTLGPAWQRAQVDDNDLVFHRAGHGSISATATCHDYDDVPPDALLQHLLFGATQRVYLSDEQLALDGRGARHAVVLAELDGVPVRLEVYVLTRDRCVFDLSHVQRVDGEPSSTSDPDFARFVQGFHVQAVRRD